ncbi:MAG: dephospho-CoA kinase [Gammaproteobacteria bacterium]|nr:dephospho-CoA kinase [Gammaproteobacteria bacterium]
MGLTGGIASGKTTVSNMFAELGVPVIDTDVIAREIVRPGEPALKQIRDRFGDNIIDDTGRLDRRALRDIVFASEEARRDLEAILHPAIGRETRRQADALGGPYQLIVVPLLVGSKLLELVDRVLVVDCDPDLQFKRLLARDAESPEQANRILAAQPRREDRLAIADDVILNDSDLDRLSGQIKELDQLYRDFASSQGQSERLP